MRIGYWINSVESQEKAGVYYNNTRLISIIESIEGIEVVRVKARNNTIISYLRNLFFMMCKNSIADCKYFISDGFIPLLGRPKMIGIVNDLMTVTREVQKSLKRRIVMGIYFRLLRLRAYKIFAISKTTASALVKKYHIDPEKIEVIYPVIETPPDVSDLPSAGVINDNNLKLVFIGANRSNKNISTLVRAVEILRKRGVEVHLSMIGPYSNGDYLQLSRLSPNLITNGILEIYSNITTNKKYEILRRSNFLVLPSLQEGFGMPCIEAFSVGLPVICSDIPALREVTEDYGIFFNPKSPDHLAIKILEAQKKIFNKDRMKLIFEKYGLVSSKKRLSNFFSCN